MIIFTDHGCLCFNVFIMQVNLKEQGCLLRQVSFFLHLNVLSVTSALNWCATVCKFLRLSNAEFTFQGDFVVWYGKRKRLRRVFLFEHLLVFTKSKKEKARGDAFVYKHSVKVCLRVFFFSHYCSQRLVSIVSGGNERWSDLLMLRSGL